MKSDLVIEKFADMMIQRMEQMKDAQWQRGWIKTTFGDAPINLRGTAYNGTNAFLLYLLCDLEGWKYPIFATINQINECGGKVNKGEKSFPVIYWKVIYETKDGKRLDYKQYSQLSEGEQNLCDTHPMLRSYNVFNVCQTNLEEVKPSAVEKLKARFGIKEPPTDTFGMYENAEIDEMLGEQKWLCPIRWNQYSNRACYRPLTDDIVIPMKSQFFAGETDDERFLSGMRYYDVLLHEMAHSTGHETRLNRKSDHLFGSSEYAKEELVAELSGAICGQRLGFDHRLLDNNACYLDSWIGCLKQEPRFIVSVLADVNKAVRMIMNVVNKEQEELVTVNEE